MSVYAKRLATQVAAATLVVNTPNTTQIIAAPGAGRRHRLYDIAARSGGGANTTIGTFTIGAVIGGYIGISGPSYPFHMEFLTDVGIPGEENQPISVTMLSTVVGTFVALVWYSTENV